MIKICPLCDAKFTTITPDQAHCSKCLAELAYLFATGHTPQEVKSNRKLVN
jgi:predicted amidophosphoribosyltransferase